MTQAAFDFSRFDAEMYLAKRLQQHGRKIFTGDTDPEKRRESFRRAIIEADLGWVAFGRSRATGKLETYAQFFERFYAEPLEPKRKRKATA